MITSHLFQWHNCGLGLYHISLGPCRSHTAARVDFLKHMSDYATSFYWLPVGMTIIFQCLAMAKETSLLALRPHLIPFFLSFPATNHIGLFYTPQMHMALFPPGVSAFALLFVWNISRISNPFHTVTWFFLGYFKAKLKCQPFRENFPEEPAKVELPFVPPTSHFLSHCTVSSSSWHLTLTAVILFICFPMRAFSACLLIILSTICTHRIWQPVFFCLIPRTLSRAQHVLGDQ